MARLSNRNIDLDHYMAEINRHPLLTREQETTLAERYRKTNDTRAAHQLVVANLRFVVKICHEYSGYGLDLIDLVQEGSIGLMQAVRKFDPSKGFRLISYAVWWIRAVIQNFIQHSWSLVKLGTTQAQRKLFFKLRSEREHADRDAGVAAPAGVDVLAKRFGVAESDIVSMESRLAGRDLSLNAEIRPGGDQTPLDLLSSSGPSPEETASDREERQLAYRTAHRAIGRLNERERYIVDRRVMATDNPLTLREIGVRFQISRERVRQIESDVLGKIRRTLSTETSSNRLCLSVEYVAHRFQGAVICYGVLHAVESKSPALSADGGRG